MDLAGRHYQKYKEQESVGDTNDRFALLHYTDTLRDALYIARERKKNEGVRSRYEELLRQLAQAHERMDLEKEKERNYLFHLTDMAIAFSKDAKEIIDLRSILEKNRKAAERYREEEASYGIELAKLCEELSNKTGEPTEEWIRYQAEAYEALAEKDKEGPRHFAAVLSIRTANGLYRKLKDEEGVERTGKEYARLRPEARKGLQQFKEEASEEESREIHEKLHREAHGKEPEEVVKDFVRCPMFSPVKVIREEVEEQLEAPPIHFYSQGHILDKFGNTIEIYPSRSKAYFFWHSYGLHFQVGAQLLVPFFKEALEAGTLDEGKVIKFLEGTWLNEAIRASAHPDPSVVPLDLIRPCLKSFFRELNQWKTDGSYEPDLVSLTDSLILKVEALIRYLCYRIGIETFKAKNKGGSQENEVVMEKSLDELLYDLKGLEAFWENDRYFIKFLMTHRMGLNLRNNVAHGLLDANEYTLEKPVLAFTALMRLSKYQFNEKGREL